MNVNQIYVCVSVSARERKKMTTAKKDSQLIVDPVSNSQSHMIESKWNFHFSVISECLPEAKGVQSSSQNWEKFSANESTKMASEKRRDREEEKVNCNFMCSKRMFTVHSFIHLIIFFPYIFYRVLFLAPFTLRFNAHCVPVFPFYLVLNIHYISPRGFHESSVNSIWKLSN